MIVYINDCKVSSIFSWHFEFCIFFDTFYAVYNYTPEFYNNKKEVYEYETEKGIWNTTGFAQAAKNSGAEMVSFESEEKAPVEFFSNGKNLEAYVTKEIYNADCVINLSKMKTHNLTRITGAVKNNFGFIDNYDGCRNV